MSMVKDVWIANFLREEPSPDGNTMNVYDTPFKIKQSINSVSGDYEFQLFGERISKMCKIMPSFNKYFNKIHEKDAVYIFGVTPLGEKRNGINANYTVKSVLPQNIKMIVYLEKK